MTAPARTSVAADFFFHREWRTLVSLQFLSFSMYETFNSQSKNIGELLGGNERAKLVVPKFQRGYSWEKKHVEAFWTDVTTFQKESAVKEIAWRSLILVCRSSILTGLSIQRRDPETRRLLHS